MIKLTSLQKGLVLHLSLDQESYNPATKRFSDRSAYSNHGTSANAANFTTDRMGQGNRATLFNGTSDYIVCNNALEACTNEMTISIFFNASSTGIRYPLNLGDDFGRLEVNTDLRFLLWDTSFKILRSIDNIITGQWYLFVGTYKENDVMTMYLNDIYQDSTAIGTLGGSDRVIIGTRPTPDRFYDGGANDVWIHNRILSNQERTFLYESYRPKVTIK